MRPVSSNHGFSLTELAIVLVIIGVIVGGAMTGKSLLRASELKSVLTEFEHYRSSLALFSNRYGAMPGDFRRATEVWGEADPTPATCQATDSTTLTSTCNGDGDGLIGDRSDATEHYERFRAWQQLALARFVLGDFSGIAGSSGTADAVVGSNIPRSDFNDAGWNIFYAGTLSSVANYFDGTYDHVLSIGQDRNWETEESSYQAFVPQEAWGIDDKADDGMPATGNVVAYNRDQCAVKADGSANPASTDLDALYNRSVDGEKCALIFRNLYLR